MTKLTIFGITIAISMRNDFLNSKALGRMKRIFDLEGGFKRCRRE